MLRLLWTRARTAARRSRWGLVVALATYLIFAGIFATTPVTQRPGSDGYYTWLYTRSLVYDHDIDFTNDYAICGDPYGKNVNRGTGHPDNPFYVGPSVIWAPILWTLRVVAPPRADAPREVKLACTGPLAGNTLGVAPVLGALIVLVMYRLARRHVADGPAALTAGLLGLCTQLAAYAAIMTSYSHIHDTFWAALMTLASVRASEKPRSVSRWLLAGACVGIGLLQRPVSVVMGLVPATLAIVSLWRAWGRIAIALASIGVPTFALGVLPQMLVYKYLYGSFWIGAPHGRYYMQYAHAHPWLVLFAPHGGLFFTAPVVWLTVFGVVIGLRSKKTRAFCIATVLVTAMVTWLSSAALDWHGSGTFGARRLTCLLPLFAIPTALVVTRLNRWIASQPGRARVAFGATVLGVGAFVIVGAAGGLARGRVSTDNGSSQADLYGGGASIPWQALDEHFGDIAILPAEIVFALRYHLPMRSFRAATEPLYQRNYRTLAWEMTDIGFKDGAHADLTTGMMNDADGAHVRKKRATVVFAAQWPYATKLVVRCRARTPAVLRVARGTAFGEIPYGELRVGTEMTEQAVQIPPGGFESGIIELVFESDALDAEVLFESIKIDDTTEHPAPI
jgi:hypothetical protein